MNDAATLHRRVAEANEPSPFNTKSEGFEAQEFVGQDAEPLSDESLCDALERAHLATERHLHAWLITGTERHLELAKAHIDQLIALGRIHQRSQS